MSACVSIDTATKGTVGKDDCLMVYVFPACTLGLCLNYRKPNFILLSNFRTFPGNQFKQQLHPLVPVEQLFALHSCRPNDFPNFEDQNDNPRIRF